MNNPITTSCNQIDFEKQIVFRANRFDSSTERQMLALNSLRVRLTHRMLLAV